MKILSLFDGIACGYEALQRVGIQIDTYYASEIDGNAIEIAKKNHSDIVEIGDVTKIKYNGGRIDYEKGNTYSGQIDLIIGGSPCQGFSRAGKMLNFEDPRSKLFFEFVRLVKEVKPRRFLLENVKMKKEFQDIISAELGVQPIEINSSLVSGQNRKRLYWTNIKGIEQPKDKQIKLIDILEEDPGSEYDISNSEIAQIVEGKCVVKQATKKGFIVADEGDGICLSFPKSKTRRGRVIKGKSNTLVTGGDCCVFTGGKIRKLTPVECERLQTLPDNYTAGISEQQRYKALGNRRTVDVIAHIFSFIK